MKLVLAGANSKWYESSGCKIAKQVAWEMGCIMTVFDNFFQPGTSTQDDVHEQVGEPAGSGSGENAVAVKLVRALNDQRHLQTQSYPRLTPTHLCFNNLREGTNRCVWVSWVFLI